jgi:hypothetical protein
MSDTDKAAREYAINDDWEPGTNDFGWIVSAFKAGASHERSRPLSGEELNELCGEFDAAFIASNEEARDCILRLYSALQRMRSKG